ncbi:MAG: hypothetical protein WCS28_08780 [Thiomicrospira sp.]
MRRVFWLHDACLQRPLDLRVGDRWVYIWDVDYIHQQAWSLKRQVFIYETLCELAQQGCEVYAADTVVGLADLLDEKTELVTYAAQDPILQVLINRVCLAWPNLRLQPIAGLLNLEQAPPLKRFFHYWKRVEKPLLGFE